MLDERQRKLAAAVVAVREGRLTATEAAALVKDTAAKAEDFFKGNGEAKRLNDDQMLEAALSGAGLSSEETKLFASADDDKADQIARKTLFNVAPTMPPENNATERPSTTRLRRPSRITERERYSIKREYARGGQGRIMIARDNVVGREVALKELLPELQDQEGKGTPATAAQETIGVVERFLREAKVTGQLEHPNVVPVYEIGKQENGSLYYTMKFVRGQTMAERLRDIDRLQLPKEKKLALRLKLLEPFQGICNAVAFAHSRGVIHRDLKPQNIMVGDFGETVLLDWGLARVKGQEDKIGKQLTLVATNMLSESLMKQNADGLTVDGTVFGTPHYMPPEQARADLREIDEQSDVYSLGAILYEILTGAPPYDGPTAGYILQQVMSGPPRKIKEREPNAPPDLIALCEYAMAHDKGRRMKTALQLAGEIQTYRDGGPIRIYKYGTMDKLKRLLARYRGAAVAALLIVVLLMAGGVSFFAIVINEKAVAEDLQREAEADRDKTNAALASAKAAREAQLQLERKQAEERETRRKARADAAKSLADAIEGMRVEPLISDMSARVAHYTELEERGRRTELSSEERQSNANLLMSVLGYFAAQESLFSLQASDAAAMDPLQAAEFKARRQKLAHARLLAANLAAFNSDFTQAQTLLAATEADAAEKDAARRVIDRIRDAVLAGQRKALEAALADIARGLQREGRSGPGLFAYIRKLQDYREGQTVELLMAALEPLAKRARAKETAWPRPDLDTAILACRVLGALERQAETVPILVDFLRANPPWPLQSECLIALCETRSPLAAVPVVQFLRGAGLGHWETIEPLLVNFPLSDQLLQGADVEACLNAAVLWLARGESERAISACNAALKLDGECSEAHELKGRALAKAARHDNAQEEMRAAITLAPANTRPRVVRGQLLAQQGLHAQAVIEFSNALKSERDNLMALLGRGQSRLALGDHEAALSDLARAIECQPLRAESYVSLAQVHEARRNLPAALESFAAALQTDPNCQLAYARRGLMQRTNGRQREAINDLTRALELNERDWRSLSTRAQSHAVLQEWTEAVNDANAALQLNPDDAESLLVRAETYQRLGGNETTYRKALADIRRAVKLLPNDARPLVMLADTAQRLKLWEDAADAARRARVMAPFGYTRDLKVSRDDLLALELDCRAELALSGKPTAISERIAQARGQALHAQDAASARVALELLQSIANDATWVQADKPAWAAAARKLASALLNLGFAQDSVALLDLLSRRQLSLPQDEHAAAVACVRLGNQYRDGRVQVLARNDEARKLEEAALNGKSQQERETAMQQAYAAALSHLEQSLTEDGAARADVEFLPLRTLPQWDATLKKLAQAYTGGNARERKAALEPLKVVYCKLVLPTGQAADKGLRTLDVVYSVAGERIESFDDLLARLTVQKSTYVLVVRRYRFDAAGNFVQRLENGKPVVNALGAPIWEFEELRFDMQPGVIGIQVEEGSVPGADILP